eukprot:c34812_g1_i1 orf=99-284(-)
MYLHSALHTYYTSYLDSALHITSWIMYLGSPSSASYLLFFPEICFHDVVIIHGLCNSQEIF